MDIRFRKATKNDIDDIYYVETHCFRTPWSKDSIRDDINENDRALYVVATDNGRIIGFCAMHTVLDEGHIMNLAVLEEFRGQRIGEKLLKKAFEFVPAEVTCYTLEVRASNASAIKLYTRLGFKRYGLRPGYYEDTGEDAIIMWLGKGFET